LSIDKVEIGIHVICLQSLYSVAFLLISEVHYFTLFLLQVCFGQIGILFYLAGFFLVKLNKLFLMLHQFFQKLLSAGTPADLLSISHLLLKTIQSPRFFFR